MKTIFSLLIFLTSHIAFADNWQNTWSLERKFIIKSCMAKYDKSAFLQKQFNKKAYLTSCLDLKREGYNAMQSDFGMSTGKAISLKNNCSRVFKKFSTQVMCMKNETNHKQADASILAKCDFNDDGVINNRTDVKLGRANKETAMKEVRCESKNNIAKGKERQILLKADIAKIAREMLEKLKQ